MTGKRFRTIKVHPKYWERLNYIQRMRFAQRKDKGYKPVSITRLTLGIVRHPLSKKIEEDLLNADLPKEEFADSFFRENKGQLQSFNLFTFSIVIFLMILFFGGLIYVMGLLNTAFTDIGLNNQANAGTPGYPNLTYAAEVTFAKVNDATQGLRLVALTMIFALVLETILMGFLSAKIHPAFFFVHVLIVFLAVIFAVPISNGYESIRNSDIYGGNMLTSFTAADWVLLNLPTVVLVLGILGGIFLFINIIRAPNEGGLG